MIARLFGRSAPAAETRDAGFSALSASLGEAYAEGSYGSADRLAAVAACVRLIASSISALPVSLTVDGASGREPAPMTASARALLRRPSQRYSWPAWVGWVTRSLLLDGNAICMIVTDGRGAITELRPVPWTWLSPQLVGNGLAFDVWNRHPEAQLLGLPPRLLENDALHIRGQSDAGIIGQSVLSRARGPVREGMQIETTAFSLWRNGMRPSATLTLPTFLDDKRRERFETEYLPKFTGALAAGRVPVLEGGWKMDQVALSSVDSEFLATRVLNTSQVAMLFGVPEVLLQIGQRLPSDLAPYVTAFAQLALAPIVTSIEAEFDHVVLPDGMHLAIDLDGLMRGSFSATVAALAALLQAGAVTANDVRQQLQWPPIEGGDVLRPTGAPSWPADFKGSSHLGPSPGPTGNAPPEPGANGNQGSG